MDEYTFRYSKHHAWENKLSIIKQNFLHQDDDHKYIPDLDIFGTFTSPYLAMPDDCKTSDFVESYRNYYLKYKRHLFKWTKREIPWWVQERINEGCSIAY